MRSRLLIVGWLMVLTGCAPLYVVREWDDYGSNQSLRVFMIGQWKSQGDSIVDECPCRFRALGSSRFKLDSVRLRVGNVDSVVYPIDNEVRVLLDSVDVNERAQVFFRGNDSVSDSLMWPYAPRRRVFLKPFHYLRFM